MSKNEAKAKREQVSMRHIWEARKRISSIIQKTPLIKSTILSEHAGSPVYLKLENVHEIGAFKVRGAANKILSLTPEEQKKGVTTFSTGNHGLAVAYVANQLGIKAIICISERVPKVKVDAIKRLGAQVIIEGHGQDDAENNCYRLQKEKGLTVIKPFDDLNVIAGQGTIGLEILEDLPNVNTVVVPLSGGGLLSGIGLALKVNEPMIQVKGVTMERSSVMYESLKAGRPVVIEEEDTLADSLLGGIGLDNQFTFQLVQQYMDDLFLISEEAIAEAMVYMLEKQRMVVEGAAATGVAAILQKKVLKQDGNIVVVISGSNVDLSLVMQLLHKIKV